MNFQVTKDDDLNEDVLYFFGPVSLCWKYKLKKIKKLIEYI